MFQIFSLGRPKHYKAHIYLPSFSAFNSQTSKHLSDFFIYVSKSVFGWYCLNQCGSLVAHWCAQCRWLAVRDTGIFSWYDKSLLVPYLKSFLFLCHLSLIKNGRSHVDNSRTCICLVKNVQGYLQFSQNYSDLQGKCCLNEYWKSVKETGLQSLHYKVFDSPCRKMFVFFTIQQIGMHIIAGSKSHKERLPLEF